MNPIICIPGPTASGKTALAVELAKEYHGEVVSCDSMQVYRRMDIGTAKPSAEERQGIVHHMLDVADLDEEFSVSKYCTMADAAIQDILSRGKTAILAGGTGLYMDSLIKGNDFAPIPATGVRQQLEAKAAQAGMEALREELRSVDPESADRLCDLRRIIRALEVYYETGETITEHNRRTQALPPKYTPLWIGLDFAQRSELYRRIDLRVDLMLKMGLLQEIEDLLGSGIPSGCTAMQAIGYKEFVNALEGRGTMAQAVEEVKKSSRHYAKRQLTWFRRNKNIHWLIRQENQDSEEILRQARQIIGDFDI